MTVRPLAFPSGTASHPAAANSSAGSNGVGTLDTPFADPDMEMIRAKMNEMIPALRR